MSRFEKLIQIALENGASEAEVYYNQSASISVRVFNSQIDDFSSSSNQGYSLRGIFNGKCGSAYSEIMTDEAFVQVVSLCKDNASIMQIAGKTSFSEKQKINEVTTYYPSLEKITVEVMKQMALEIEKKIYQTDPRIHSVIMVSIGYHSGSTIIENSKGVDLFEKSNGLSIGCELCAKDENGVVSNFKVDVVFDQNDFDLDQYVKSVVDEVISKLSPRVLPSGTYPAILTNDVSALMLAALSRMFFADQIQRNLSVIKGKINQKIFSDLITIKDDPLLEKGYRSCSFDSEGTACYNKTVVENGVFKTALYDKISAAADKTVSTGNGFRSSYKGSVNVKGTNFYIDKGTKSYDELVACLDKGVIITNFMGIHAGLNPITTDFSLQAQGYYVENGKIAYPISLITAAGNYMDLMNHVVEVGEDLKFLSYSMMAGVGSPSILFDALIISGK